MVKSSGQITLSLRSAVLSDTYFSSLGKARAFYLFLPKDDSSAWSCCSTSFGEVFMKLEQKSYFGGEDTHGRLQLCSHLAHHPRMDQRQQIAAERLDPTTQLQTQSLKANRRNVNIVLMLSLRRYWKNAYSRTLLLRIPVVTNTSCFETES